MKNAIVLCLTCVAVLTMLLIAENCYCTESGSEVSSKINFDAKFKLENTDKIIIETLKYSDKQYRKILVVDEAVIHKVLEGLDNIEGPVGIDTICDYSLSFYDKNKRLLELEFIVYRDYPQSSFIRYTSKTDEISEDYLINNKLYLLLSSLIE